MLCDKIIEYLDVQLSTILNLNLFNEVGSIMQYDHLPFQSSPLCNALVDFYVVFFSNFQKFTWQISTWPKSLFAQSYYSLVVAIIHKMPSSQQNIEAIKFVFLHKRMSRNDFYSLNYYCL